LPKKQGREINLPANIADGECCLLITNPRVGSLSVRPDYFSHIFYLILIANMALKEVYFE
jgi:hypothetical protein